MEEIVLLVAIGVLRVKPADSGKMCALWGNPSPCVTWSLKEASPDQKILALRDDFLLESGKETEVSVDLRRARFRGPWVGKIWRRKWQLSPGFLSGKFHGQRCLTGYSLWVCNESDMTEQTHTHTHTHTDSEVTESEEMNFQSCKCCGEDLWLLQVMELGVRTSFPESLSGKLTSGLHFFLLEDVPHLWWMFLFTPLSDIEVRLI